MFEVLKYIHKNINQNLDLSEVAARFGYSKWYFSSKFHSYTGKTFIAYLRHYRMQLAASDLLLGKKAVDIAMDYGYDTPGGFNKAFLTEFGCLPREYIKQIKEARFYYERRRCTMLPLTARCEALRNQVTRINDYEDFYCMQHKVYTTIGMSRALKNGLSHAEITSGGMVNLLMNFKPVIAPRELIVGFHFSHTKYRQFFAPNDTEDHRRLAKLNGISDADMDLYFEIMSRHRTVLKLSLSK